MLGAHGDHDARLNPPGRRRSPCPARACLVEREADRDDELVQRPSRRPARSGSRPPANDDGEQRLPPRLVAPLRAGARRAVASSRNPSSSGRSAPRRIASFAARSGPFRLFRQAPRDRRRLRSSRSRGTTRFTSRSSSPRRIDRLAAEDHLARDPARRCAATVGCRRPKGCSRASPPAARRSRHPSAMRRSQQSAISHPAP